MSGVTPTLAVRSCPSSFDFGYDVSPSFLDSCRLPTSVEPLTPPTPTYTTTMLVPTNMQESSLSHNELTLCLRSFLRPSSALSPCEFATCMRALIPSPVPACLRSLPRPSLSLSPCEARFWQDSDSVCTTVLTVTLSKKKRVFGAVREKNRALRGFLVGLFTKDDIWGAQQLRTGCLSIIMFLAPLAEVTP